LPPFHPSLSERAKESLKGLNVEVMTSARVTNIDSETVTYERNGNTSELEAKTVLWAAGVKASPLGAILHASTGAEMDRAGRVTVDEYLKIPGNPDIFVLGDLASVKTSSGGIVPGVAPAAMQMGSYTAKAIRNKLSGKPIKAFRYVDKGSLAVIGRNAAVADLGFAKFGGFMAWLIWIFIHIMYLVGFDNKVLVFFQWGSNYFTRKRGARLITGEDLMPQLSRNNRLQRHDYSNQES
jgi:NADH dehydrogenase